MIAKFSTSFRKQYKKVPPGIQAAFEARLELFLYDAYHPLLNNHGLQGEYRFYRGINITGNWRALFNESENGEVAVFDIIGTHSELYG